MLLYRSAEGPRAAERSAQKENDVPRMQTDKVSLLTYPLGRMA
jgi:hypothetical protein